MKRIMTKSLLVLSVSAMMTAAAAAHAAEPQQPQPVQAVPISAAASVEAIAIEIDGVKLTETGYRASATAETMIPLRAVTEKLGFTLNWKQEDLSVDLSKGPLFTTVKTGDDRYAVNKMYKTLGAAPVLLDNKLYVPASFVVEVLHGRAVTEGSKVTISMEQPQHMQTTGVITSVYQGDKRASIQIQGAGVDGLVLNIGEDTVIQSHDGKTLTLSDLHIGLTVEAEHSLAATLSLPPQTAAFKVTVLDTDIKQELLGTSGTIEEARTGDNGEISVVIKGQGLSDQSPDEVILRVSDKTELLRQDGTQAAAADLVKGAKVLGFYSPVLTKSLPPIGGAVKLVVHPEAAE
ncbi:Copper amine oxidase N-terminal domain-containing protein [Paenibacillus sp. UNCCL117]|uniref:copper amine oxidase N-terminal domain-containing protein n=1 Tax=unclassified Paenibacillus TaxID=185978 RepID=UPI00087EE7D4|nr:MULTISPECIES: copper amine oxidase N-terminal domain-containing protein [unclassified Paenibacillus]SDD13659.1 Copper amine oxidase N-terminal domain-containing protein [Paenibacillus sp. cl123]SFW34035.1 Copper amine oxidase N-terminal domain-containing protein [Paenibacillus sp. UNCCL117]